MLEDSKGYLWIGTPSGLSRWDGITFKNYSKNDGLLSSSIHAFAETDSTILIGTKKGINVYKGNQLSKFPSVPDGLNDRINAILVDGGKIYFGCENSGLWLLNGEKYLDIGRLYGFPDISVKCLELSENRLYIGTSENGLFVLQDSTIKRLPLSDNDKFKQINKVYTTQSGDILIGSRDGLIIRNEKTTRFITVRNGLPDNFVNDICPGVDGEFYIATLNGIGVLKDHKITDVITEKNGLSSSFIWDILKSRSGTCYLATDGTGIDIFQPKRFENFNTDTGLPNNNVWSIHESNDGIYYFGTDKGLAAYRNGKFKTYSTADGLSSEMIVTIHEAKDGTIYLGTDFNGVTILKNNHFAYLNTGNGLTNDLVWSIAEDDKGNIYLGTYENGICVFDGKKMIDTLTVEDGLPGNAITAVYKSEQGDLYFGTENTGAFKLSKKHRHNIETILPQGTVWSILKDNVSDKLYLGVDETGLIVYEKGIKDTIDVRDGLSNNTVIGIMQDDDGKLFLTTDNGFNILNFSKDSLRIRSIYKSDGLASNECNQGAYLRDSQGNIWIGTVGGVSKYQPEYDVPESQAPQVHFTAMQLFNKDIPLNRDGILQKFNFNENYFNFEYIGIDLDAPSKVRYKYRLTGIDEEWVSSTRRFAQYTNLNNGMYTFSVKAQNQWGVWSTPKSISFYISPPFWKTWWFFLLATAMILFPIALIIYTRIHRVLALERLRAKIAADLHDDIGSGLSEINILSAVVEAKSPPSLKNVVKNELDKIGSVSRALIESMSDIVWIINPKNDSLHDLFTRLKDSFADVFELKNIEFKTTNLKHLDKINLPMENRQHLFLVFKEALNNAVKYGECSRIDLKVNIFRRKLQIHVSDNGKGFNMDSVKKGNGLVNMKRRAEKVNGNLTFHSEPGKGTEVTFSVRI